MKAHKVVAWTGTVALAIVSLFLAERGSTYQWSFLFLTPLLWGVYFFRGRLELLPFHFGLFVLAVLLHDLGTFGFYNRVFLALRFDSYVHFVFGLVAGLILYRALRVRVRFAAGTLWVAVPLLILGWGAIHELLECASTLVLGPERGMLKLRPGEPFDTQKDLFNNLLGASLATAYYSIKPVTWKDGQRAPLLEPALMRKHSKIVAASGPRRPRRRAGSAVA